MFHLPIVLSTIGVGAAFQEDTLSDIKEILEGGETVDRHTVDAWDSAEFHRRWKRPGDGSAGV